MKKLIVAILVLFFANSAVAWDLYTYPIGKDDSATDAPDMRQAVIFYFTSEAIKVQFNSDSETSTRIEFAKRILAGDISQNELSRQVATNPSIGSKITSSDDSFINDIAYVVSTQYSPDMGTPLFTILAESAFGE